MKMRGREIKREDPSPPKEMGIHSSRLQSVIVAAAFIAYLVAFFPLHSALGNIAGIFVTGPVLLAACFFGLRGGLIAGLLTYPVNVLLVGLVSDPDWDKFVYLSGPIGSGAEVLVAAVTGRLRDLGQKVNNELVQRRVAQTQLSQRTRELTETTQILEKEAAERQLAEEGLELRNQELEALLKIATILARPGVFVQKCTNVLDELSRLIQADWVTLRQAHGEEQSLFLVAKAGPATMENPPMPVLTERETLAANAFQNMETIVVNDYDSHPVASPVIVSLGMKSMVLMPLQAHGRRLGLINAVSMNKDHFTPERVRLFTAIGE